MTTYADMARFFYNLAAACPSLASKAIYLDQARKYDALAGAK